MISSGAPTELIQELPLITNFQAITSCMHLALHDLSNAQQPGFGAVYLNVPEPLEARDPNSWMLYPWRTFINKSGSIPLKPYSFEIT